MSWQKAKANRTEYVRGARERERSLRIIARIYVMEECTEKHEDMISTYLVYIAKSFQKPATRLCKPVLHIAPEVPPCPCSDVARDGFCDVCAVHCSPRLDFSILEVVQVGIIAIPVHVLALGGRMQYRRRCV